MSHYYMFQLAIPAVVLLSFGLTLWLQRKYIGRNYERRRRLQLAGTSLAVFFFASMAYQSLFITGQYLLASVLLIGSAVMLISVLLGKSEDDSRTNYGLDPAHCGQCGYDLRGTAGPTCPECGWAIPPQPAPFQRPDWALWWRGWQIDYLNHWKRDLATALVFLPVFIAMFVWLCWANAFVFAAIAGFVAANMGINIIRIVQYARRATHEDSK